MKKHIKSSLIMFVVILLAIPQLILASTNNDQLDAVLVIDASGSMKETDPNKLGLEGVKLFVDMMAATGNQVGLVTYGGEVGATYPMTKVDTKEDKEAIKSFVDHISRELEYTDITTGLKEALKMQEARDTSWGNSPLIIIFTDGNNAVGGVENRDNQIIDQELEVLLKEAKNKNYPIYTIGLNDNGKLNEEYLKNISEQTGALAFATKDAKDLPDILIQIFASHSNLKVQSLQTLTGTGEYEEVVINIPNNNVLEANISVASSSPISFKLVDPQGDSRMIPSEGITLHESSAYQLLKIAKPSEGDWKLYVKGAKGDKINIDLVYNYDLEVSLEPLGQTDFGKGDTLNISAYLSLQGSPIEDDGLYQKATSTLILRDTNTGIETRVNMVTNNQRFEGSYKLKEEGNFEVSVLVEDSSYERESNTIPIKVGKAGSKPVDTLNHEEDESGDNKVLFYVITGVGVLVLLIGGGVAFKVIQAANRPLVGQMVIELRDQATGKLMPPQYKRLNVFKGKVSLHALLQFAPEFKEAEKILLKSAAGDKVVLYNHSDYAIEKAGRAVKADTGVELKKGDRFIINMADIGQSIQIEYLL